MGWELIFEKMGESIKANGARIWCTATEFSLGLKEDHMKDSTFKIKSRGKEYSLGLMGRDMKVSGGTESNMVKEC